MIQIEQYRSVLLVDITSPEVNRGSYCYLPYILHSVLQNTPYTSGVFIENFGINMLDKVLSQHMNQFEAIYASLWSYPQIEEALLINRLSPIPVYFYGYRPLIQALGLNEVCITDNQLKEGLRRYPSNIADGRYTHVLLSDCDKHLQSISEDEAPKMFPLFTTYSCPNGCAFCSATVNSNRKQTILDIPDVIHNLEKYNSVGAHIVHFTDEDFFLNTKRAIEILYSAWLLSPEFQFIALGETSSVLRFNRAVKQLKERNNIKYTAIKQVLKLIEIGLETADDSLASQMDKVHRKGQDKIKEAKDVYDSAHCKLLWLCMTFFPGETISTLNATGSFLRTYGLNKNELVPRIVTNGTEGGLGQFFQIYHGCREQEIVKCGIQLTDRPMRLIPSFLPFSYLDSTGCIDINWFHTKKDEFGFWLQMYKIDVQYILDSFQNIGNLLSGNAETMRKIIEQISFCDCSNEALQSKRFFKQKFIDAIIASAIACRLGIILPA